ncbi:glucosyl/glucuronosyl transferase, putative [Talaromyces stipitatus ATCC 10500]|uniref:Glucosyl/glucuronosyl transferase, putative n=1 Tax=Talaromyces stipitatus (strain ATCC 10500 / CBS 375.48 / QM 6759 / NRRL 1006) TaxID=441959 RepID=B8MB17_TALSN|nr:glucosyl/glucuronosyl transferase, putative [Talaromyces stipitatus ATCC 10500]EED18718.1 glucosyl/glucuronosyl transferase, putative [Talaromyces stipitatus ATCC 10500]
MTTQSSSEEETAVQQSILQQAQAAAAAQNNTRQETSLQKIDLISADPTEDYIPPPAYGEIYGEIHNEENGLDTSARVTDDGRVNIRINQVNRRLSQIFTPALREQVQSGQESRPPPSPYIPASLRGEEGVPPPQLNIVIQIVGSRGDVQPFVALGKVLKDTYGHRVRLATHPNFKDFVQENGLEFFSIGGDPSQLMAFMVKNPSLMPGFRSLLGGDVGQRRRDVAEYIQGCWRSCYEAGDGMGLGATEDDLSEPSPEHDSSSKLTSRPFVADCIIANPPSFAHIHCAEKLGIPLHIMFTMPYSPTQAFPHPLANIQSSNADPQLTNYISYVMIEVLSWQGLGDIINRFRAKCLNLDPVSLIWAPGMLHRLKVPHTYCWSPALIPKPQDWARHISVSGYYFLNLASNYTPTPDFQAFLDAGPPPVYIGFGSIVLDDPNAMMELIFEAVRKTGQRVLLSQGWGGMGADKLNIPDGVFMLDNVPHDWLFKHVSCVVHHGGAGTTAAGITAGRPTVVVPFFGDQLFWGTMVARAGAGPDPIPQRQLTADKLADAINFCLKPSSLERAKELASKIAAERGSDMGAQSFHQHLEVDRLRCTLAPSRPATWRVKRTQVRLSAFAACTLANAKLLDFHDLKLFRPQEYLTDEGPWDPISGGATAVIRAFSGMAMGVAEFPSETLKPLHMAVGSSRQQSQLSVSANARKAEMSDAGERSTVPTSPENIETSSNVQESLAHVQSSPSLSRLSSSTSNTKSSSMSDALHGKSGPKYDYASRSQVRNRNKSSTNKNHDMLRQTGVHTSKGLGRIIKAAVQAPMEISVSFTKGFHNAPKLWGDDTVRPQEKVVDFKSGAMAAGREFGFGWYDGVTGLFTQPWKGAQKEGTSGFLKGIGKGIGGFVAKPSAALFGILGHTMKGVHKEVQRLFGSNVQNYIVASRVAQGYEEWLQSSDAEKQDVIVRWKLIQKYLKIKGTPDEMVQDVLEAQRKKNTEDTGAPQNYRHTAGSAQSTSEGAPESTMLAMCGSQSSEESLEQVEINEIIPVSVQETSCRDAEEDSSMEPAIEENVLQLQHRRHETADHQAEQENLRQAIAASETEAQRQATEELEFERQLKRAMAKSLREQRQSSSGSSAWQSDRSLDDEDEDDDELLARRSEDVAEKGAAGESSGQQPPSYNPTMQSEFVAQQHGQRWGKTTQERAEEEIVMEYVKKQSLLELYHQNKGKGRATSIEDKDDEDLQKTLKLSMQGHEFDETSGM